MDQLTNAAMIGTTRLGNSTIQTDSPVDTLSGALPGAEAEQRLLLQAGAWAVYRLAGTQPQQGIALPAQAEPETMPPCSPTAANLIRVICADHQELLAEALNLLRNAGQRMSFDLLPLVLDQAQRQKDLRPRILHVIGERGQWLGRFNPAWSWVAAPLDDGDSLPPDAEIIWNEGPIEQRCEMLRRVRLADPAKGREWLAAVWKSERADQRYNLLSGFAVTLEADDIPFLEGAAQDRVEKVREQAKALLAHIPDSALAERLRRRAATMIQIKPDGVSGKILLDITPPSSLSDKEEKEWQQDGLDLTPRRKVGKRSWWLMQSIANVPPPFWESHLGLTVADLITAAESTEYAAELLEGWAEAECRFRSANWALPLWEWWQQVDISQMPGAESARDSLLGLLPYHIPAPEREALALRVLAIPDQQEIVWKYLAPTLPQPWGHAFGVRYLEIARTHIEAMIQDAINHSDEAYNLLMNTSNVAGLALLPSCFAKASEPMDIPEDLSVTNYWRVQQVRTAVEKFLQTIQLRQRLHKEIH